MLLLALLLTSAVVDAMDYRYYGGKGCLESPYNTYTDKYYTTQSCYDKCVADKCNFFSMTSRHPGKCWTSTAGSFWPTCYWNEDVYGNQDYRSDTGETALAIGPSSAVESAVASQEEAVGGWYAASTAGCLRSGYKTYIGQTINGCFSKCLEDNCNFFAMTSRHTGKCWTSTAGSFWPTCYWNEDVYGNPETNVFNVLLNAADSAVGVSEEEWEKRATRKSLNPDDAEAAVGGSSSFFVSNDEDTVDDYGYYACTEKEGTKNAGGVWFCSDWYGYDCDGDVTSKCPVCCNPPTAPSTEEKERLESKYPAITSGTCGSNAMNDITTQSDCTKAIEIRNLFTSEANYKFNKATTSKRRAGGCVVSTAKGNKGYLLSETGTATSRSTASAAYVYFCKPGAESVAVVTSGASPFSTATNVFAAVGLIVVVYGSFRFYYNKMME